MWLAATAALLPGPVAWAEPFELARLLTESRSSISSISGISGSSNSSACNKAPDTLARVLCSGQMRVGVRSDYPPFAQRLAGVPRGFEIDLALDLANRLGVQAQFVPVTPANRLALLGEERVDVVIAATGHTLLRDAQALFVRPHYYQSRTVVVGPRGRALATLDGLTGKTVCVTVGNATNAELATHGARLMLYGDAKQLVEQLRSGACTWAAQDDSLFAHYLQQKAFSSGLAVKLGFSPLPWGAVVGKAGGDSLARALGLALQDLHADGNLLRLAQLHDVETPFLQAEEAHWNTPACRAAAAIADPRCVNPPLDNRLEATAIAPQVARLEAWLQKHWDWQVTLAMLKTQVALKLFVEGVAFSLALVAGAVAVTLALGLACAAGLGAASRWVRWPLRAVVMTMQSTPLVLLMVFAGVLNSALGAPSALTALAAATVVLGLFNGSNAGQAIAEARASLRAEGQQATLRQALLRARAQVVAFVVNATRGSPAASLIGVPELLSAQTDIASFSSERVTTFTLLLVFYMALVSLVVWLGQRWQNAAAARAGHA